MFRAGYLQGDAVVGSIARLSLPVAADRLRHAAAAACGVAAAALVLAGARSMGPVAGALAALAVGAGYGALLRGAGLLPAAYAVIAAATSTAVVAARFTGGP
jgi:PTS system mannose-specific IID component